MLKIILIATYFGKLPEWFDKWLENIKSLKRYGYELLLVTDLAEFNARASKVFGVTPPIVEGGEKVWDWRPALGQLYANELYGSAFWGTTDIDCVYGNVGKFMTPELLKDADIITDETDYIGGHWTLYRNTEKVNGLYLQAPNSKRLMLDPRPNGWVETEYTKFAEANGLRIKYHRVQATRDNAGLELKDGGLYQNGKEVMLAHFKDQKRWPL